MCRIKLSFGHSWLRMKTSFHDFYAHGGKWIFFSCSNCIFSHNCLLPLHFPQAEILVSTEGLLLLFISQNPLWYYEMPGFQVISVVFSNEHTCAGSNLFIQLLVQVCNLLQKQAAAYRETRLWFRGEMESLLRDYPGSRFKGHLFTGSPWHHPWETL